MDDINIDKIDGVVLTASKFIEECDNAEQYVYSQNGYGRIVRDPRGYPNIAKLKNEIIPISEYLKYLRVSGRTLNRIKIIWTNGSQKGDAKIYDKKWILLEVTTARHPNEYLVRHRLNQSGVSFSADGLSKINGYIKSIPVAIDYSEDIRRYKKWICDRIEKKSEAYEGMDIRLIIYVISDGFLLNDEIESIEKLFDHYMLPDHIEYVFVSFGGINKCFFVKNKNAQQ